MYVVLTRHDQASSTGTNTGECKRSWCSYRCQCCPFTGKVVVITTRLIPVAGGMVMDQNGMVKVWLILGRLMCSLITGARLLGRSSEESRLVELLRAHCTRRTSTRSAAQFWH